MVVGGARKAAPRLSGVVSGLGCHNFSLGILFLSAAVCGLMEMKSGWKLHPSISFDFLCSSISANWTQCTAVACCIYIGSLLDLKYITHLCVYDHLWPKCVFVLVHTISTLLYFFCPRSAMSNRLENTGFRLFVPVCFIDVVLFPFCHTAFCCYINSSFYLACILESDNSLDVFISYWHPSLIRYVTPELTARMAAHLRALVYYLLII